MAPRRPRMPDSCPFARAVSSGPSRCKTGTSPQYEFPFRVRPSSSLHEFSVGGLAVGRRKPVGSY